MAFPALCTIFLSVCVATQSLTLRTHVVEDPWPTMRGPFLHQFGTSKVVGPSNLSAALLWSFHHPDGRYNTLVCGGPVIDAQNNLYLSMNDGVRKFSPSGEVLWHFQQEKRNLNNQVSLFNGSVFTSNEDGVAFSLDQRTGQPVWQQKVAARGGPDCGYPAAYDGVFVMASNIGTVPGHEGGNQVVMGLAAATGQRLWEFRTKMPVWNFEPLFTEDGSVLFMDFEGSMYSLSLHSGGLNWLSSAAGSRSFTDGGAALGPNGAVYSCSNPKGTFGNEGSQGLLRALQAADGRELWQQTLPQPCNSYPAIGRLGDGAQLSVVVTPGSFMGDLNLHGSIMAFDATTGELQWRYNTQPFKGVMAKGDMAGLATRLVANPTHAICLPAHWSSANIAGDGTVYAGRADGLVYAVRGPSMMQPVPMAVPADSPGLLTVDFASTPGLQVRTWDADGAFLHGAFAFAPGLMAAATCDTLFLFRAAAAAA